MFKFPIRRYFDRFFYRALVPALVLYLAPTTITATAGTHDGIRFLNDGRPVQVTVAKPARDLNHVEDFNLARLPERAAAESFGAATKSVAGPSFGSTRQKTMLVSTSAGSNEMPSAARCPSSWRSAWSLFLRPATQPSAGSAAGLGGYFRRDPCDMV